MSLPGNTLQRRSERFGYLYVEGTGNIDFYENPRIVEKKRAGYNKTDIFKRRAPLRLWVGSTALSIDIEIRFTLPHIAAMFGSADKVDEAIKVARKSVEPRDPNSGRLGPGVCKLVIEGSMLTYPPCIVTSYEIASEYENGAFGNDSRVIIIRLTLEEFWGYAPNTTTYL